MGLAENPRAGKWCVSNALLILIFPNVLTWYQLYSLGGPTVFKDLRDWIMIDDLYFHINRYMILEDANVTSTICNSNPEKGLGIHTPVSCIRITSANEFLHNVVVQWIDGVSLWIDHPDIKRIDSMGYWFEIAGQIWGHMMNAIEHGQTKGKEIKPFKHIMIPNVIKFEAQKYPWILELLKIAIAPIEEFFNGNSLKLWFFHDIAKDHELWVGIERSIKFKRIRSAQRANDSYNIFNTKKNAQAFREAIWAANNVVLAPPRDITLLVTLDDAGVSNPKEVLRVLHEYKDSLFAGSLSVRPYSPTTRTSLSSLVKRMVQTKIFIARHGSLLGCSMLMQSGTFVVELMPYRYDGLNTFSLYRQMTRSLGDVHHLTISSNDTKSVIFQSDEDKKYAQWLPGECYVDDCLDAHEVAGLNVSIPDLRGLLDKIKELGVSADHEDILSEYKESPKRAPRIQANAGLWYDDDE